MPLSSGTRLGPYEIISPLGAGGMGEVYRGRDTKLGREIAIKILPEPLAQDPEQLARFEREAKVLASLNHPNIAQVYGVEDSSGSLALVMELVPGDTLAHMIERPLPIESALNWAKQIAEALEIAHEKGIVHRDFKPANVMITPEGIAKVLDFGLASVSGRGTISASDPENSPTLTMAATQAGVILGTPGYMAPEQAAGKQVDKRADIWAFGVVLYEMLTGERLFDGETITHTLANVLRAPVDFSKLPQATPPPVRNLIERCLDRSVKDRLRDIGEARIALQNYLTDPKIGTETLTDNEAKSRSRLPWLMVAGLAASTLLLGLALWSPWRAAPALVKSLEFQIAAPEHVTIGPSFAVSPDGSKLAYQALGPDRARHIYVRNMDSLETRLLDRAPNVANAPLFWSYDSRFLTYQSSEAGETLKKIELSGGPPQTLCEVTGAVVSGSWNRDGVVLFGSNRGGVIQRVSSSGGARSPVTALNAAREDRFHASPVFLPDSRHFLYLVNSAAPENTGIYVGSIESKPGEQSSKRLIDTAFAPVFVPDSDGKSGVILFMRAGTVLGQRFDVRRLEITGEAVPVAEQVGSFLSFGFFSASENGVFVYRNATDGNAHLIWMNRQGQNLGTPGQAHDYVRLRLSPDGTRVTYAFREGQRNDIWLTSLSRGNDTRFTFGRARHDFPIWSPDGERVAFTSDRFGTTDIFQHAANGAGEDELLVKSPNAKKATDWSHDGRFLLYYEYNPKTRGDLFLLPMDTTASERKSTPILQTEFNEDGARFSPDGHWIAYWSDESGRDEVYVRPFPAPAGGGGKWMISRGGGAWPAWRGDGKEIFYRSPSDEFMAVAVTTGGAAFQSTLPKALFKISANPGSWDVTADGQKFLLAVPEDAASQVPFTIVANGLSGLKSK